MNKKTLSVIFPNYNYGQYIAETLEAILSQSFRPLEVLIIDDASTDNSVEVIQEYASRYPIVRLVRNEKNMGQEHNYSKLLSMAKGDYVYATASDDKVVPGFFEKSMALLAQYPQAAFCCSDNFMFDDKSRAENKSFYTERPRYFSPSEVEELYKREAFTPFVPHSVVIKRSVFNEVGGYNADLRWSNDTFAFSVSAFRYGICYIPDPLVMIRMHPKQLGRSMSRKSSLERENVKRMIGVVRQPEYSDVLPMFKRAAPFSSHPWEVLMVVLGKRSYWEFLSFKLIRFALFDKLIRRALLRILPLGAFRKLASIGKQIKKLFPFKKV
jgi:glycosyltransferase involved in cell wall biosynthesis